MAAGALFDEEPDYGGHVSVRMELRQPEEGETGLLLLLLKDMLSGDLNVGGAGSVGRGVATGTGIIKWDGREIDLNLISDSGDTHIGALDEKIQAFRRSKSLQKRTESGAR